MTELQTNKPEMQSEHQKQPQAISGSDNDDQQALVLASDSIISINTYLQTPDASKRVKGVRRSDVLPYLFKIRGAPYSLEDYPQMRTMYDTPFTPNVIYMCGRQLGKCCSAEDLCESHNGNLTRLKDVNIGDTLLSCTPAYKTVPGKVVDKFDHGFKQLWKVRTRLGNVHNITMDHRIRAFGGFKQLRELSVGSRVLSARRGGVFTRTCDKPETDIKFTAYMLGDGCCIYAYPQFTSNCPTVRADFSAVVPGSTWVRSRKGGTTYHTNISRKVRDRLHTLGIANKYLSEKVIPGWVFDLSRQDTVVFLNCLWATDGSIKVYKGDPSFTYCSSSELLAYQVASLLRKFGILSCIRKKPTKCNGKACQDAYELRVEGQESQKLFKNTFNVLGKPYPVFTRKPRNSNRDTIPLGINAWLEQLLESCTYKYGKSLRTAGLRRKQKYPPTPQKVRKILDFAKGYGLDKHPVYVELDAYLNGDFTWDEIISIEALPEQGQTYDLMIEENHNFIVSNGLVTHNSINLSRSEVLNLISVPHLQMLYVAPLQQQTQRYSTLYLNEAIQSCELARLLQSKDLEGVLSDSNIVQSVGHEAFAHGAGIQLTYAKTSSDRARGIFADFIDFDEIQDQLVDNVPIISESLTASEYGVSRFTGTAKTADNTIEKYWQQSAQCEWSMKCAGCNTWNFPTEDGKVLDMIQATGVHCVVCGKKLDVRTGIWVPAYPDRMDSFPGYHIPQIVVPAIVEDPHKWAKVVRKVLSLPLSLIMQEVLGISYSVGARLITEADITRQSTLPSVKELQKRIGRYAMTVSGVDWGGAEQSSFTVHTIIGVRPDGKLDVLWARRFIGFNPDEVLSEIAKAHRFYLCTMMAADYGMGFAQNVMLESRFGIMVVHMQLLSQNKLLSYSPTLGHHRWTVDKTTALEVLFLSIKYGKIFFPPKEEFDLYTKDLLSPYEHVSDKGVIPTRRFLRDPSRPDDFAMALCFGCMLAMKLCNASIMDLIPAGAMGADDTPDGPPAVIDIDPVDVLAALQA